MYRGGKEEAGLKGVISREFDVISKPKTVCLSTETKKKLSSFVINYHSIAIKLSMSASGLRQNRVGMNWNLKNIRLMFLKFTHFCLPKCARTDHELFLSRIELISFFIVLEFFL